MLNEKEKKLAAYFLDLAADEFANHGCNDTEDDAWDGWATEERKKFIADFYLNNNEKKEAEEGHTNLEDWCIMRTLANKLRS